MYNKSITLTILLFVISCLFIHADEPLLYRWEPKGWDNFGDALSQPIVERILGRKVKRATSKKQKKFLAVGSIIHMANSGDIVWGSGMLNNQLPGRIKDLDVRAVRGPLTRKALLKRGISCPAVYGDPALLFPFLFPEFKKNTTQDFVIIPHLSDIAFYQLHPNCVSPKQPWESVVMRIIESEFVISSSLHGIIIAEAYGIPARMLLKNNTDQLFKYKDYYYGTGRIDFKYAKTIDEALKMGGEPPPKIDFQALLDSFPFDLWK